MSNYNSLTLREFIKFKGGNKIINGTGNRDIFIMNQNNKTVAECYLSHKIEKWSLDELMGNDLKKGGIEYQVCLEPDNIGRHLIYPMKISTIL